jgi:hypothetical protein
MPCDMLRAIDKRFMDIYGEHRSRGKRGLNDTFREFHFGALSVPWEEFTGFTVLTPSPLI